jgi:hypothetical protein
VHFLITRYIWSSFLSDVWGGVKWRELWVRFLFVPWRVVLQMIDTKVRHFEAGRGSKIPIEFFQRKKKPKPLQSKYWFSSRSNNITRFWKIIQNFISQIFFHGFSYQNRFVYVSRIVWKNSKSFRYHQNLLFDDDFEENSFFLYFRFFIIFFVPNR